MNISHIVLAALALLTQAVVAGESIPKEQLTKLYNSISVGKTEEGVSQFFATSLMAKQKEMQTKAMGNQAKGVFDFYGPPNTKTIHPFSGVPYFINVPINGNRFRSFFMTILLKQISEASLSPNKTDASNVHHKT